MATRIESDLVIEVINLQNRIQKQIGGALFAHGIGLSEYLVLNQLYHASNGKMRRSDLAQQVGLSPSGVTRLLNPMEKTGLVRKEQNPRDARISLVTLTDAGEQVYREASASFDHASTALFEPLGSQRMDTFSQLIDTLS